MPPSHGISRQRITAGGCFCIFASWFRKRWKITFPTGKIFFSNWEAEFKPKFVKPDSKPCNESFESLTGKSSEKDKTEREPSRKRGNPFWKSSARDEAKRGQNAYEPKHESIHQVSHRGRVLCRRHIPLQLVYCGSRDRKEPATTSGEQHLHPGRFFPFRSDHYHPVKAAKGNQSIISIKFNPDSKPRNESFSLPSNPPRFLIFWGNVMQEKSWQAERKKNRFWERREHRKDFRKGEVYRRSYHYGY